MRYEENENDGPDNQHPLGVRKMKMMIPLEISWNNHDNVSVTIGNETINESNSVELLGIKIDANLNLNEQVTNLCKKGNPRLHALARISNYLSEGKLKILMETFIQSSLIIAHLYGCFTIEH